MKINKITIKGKVKIYDTEEGKIVSKEKKKDLTTLFDHLTSRGFNAYPKIVLENNSEIRYKYYENSSFFYEEENDEDFIRTIGSLHYKTSFYKNVSKKKYKEIYNTLIDNIDYLKDYYNNLIRDIDGENYMSPSHYLLARNYSIINSNLIYVEKELNSWYKLVSEKTKIRVSVVNNNLRKDNFIRGDNILTSWDNYLVDTPVLDIYKLYKNEYKTMDFNSLLKIYNEEIELSKEEIKLLFIMISMPKKLEVNVNEYDKVKEVNEILNYIYRTNNLIKSGVFN